MGNGGDAAVLAAQVSEVWPAGAVLGEGPTWDAASDRVYWVDIKGRRLHAYGHRDGTRRTWDLPMRIGSLARPVAARGAAWVAPEGLPEDRFLACGDAGFMWLALDGDGVVTCPIVHPERERPGNRFNDGKMGPDGRYWAGTMDDAEAEASGCLYAFAPDGSVALIDRDYEVTNGPAFSPDGRTLYHTDSARQSIYAFDLAADGRPGPRRLLRQFGPGEGYPDGMTVDAEGCLWVAVWDGWRLQRIDPAGRLAGSVPMPTPRCTSCVFVTPRTLYVTSAAVGVEGQPGAGSLYRVVLD